jgi:hypothetical protein
MKLEALLASRRARPFISDGSPIRPSGTTAFHMSSAAAEVGAPPPRLVLNGPGAIALTRTFQRARTNIQRTTIFMALMGTINAAIKTADVVDQHSRLAVMLIGAHIVNKLGRI